MITEEKRLGHKEAESAKHKAAPVSDAEHVMLAVLQSVAQPDNPPAGSPDAPKPK